jgi:hypothetical protein
MSFRFHEPSPRGGVPGSDQGGSNGLPLPGGTDAAHASSYESYISSSYCRRMACARARRSRSRLLSHRWRLLDLPPPPKPASRTRQRGETRLHVAETATSPESNGIDQRRNLWPIAHNGSGGPREAGADGTDERSDSDARPSPGPQSSAGPCCLLISSYGRSRHEAPRWSSNESIDGHYNGQPDRLQS